MTKIVLNTTLIAGTLTTVFDAGLTFGLAATPTLVVANDLVHHRNRRVERSRI
jgi:hypothetical protein